jgi:probable rRNA maturation factor
LLEKPACRQAGLPTGRQEGMDVKITLRNLQNKVPVRTGKLKKLAFEVLKGEKIKKDGWINICFVNDRRIKEFNAKYLNTKSSTDVLAFNLSDKNKPGIILADILISTQTALKQARIYGTTADQELSLYVVHGLLHILGFNDHTCSQTKLMRKKESQYVN